MALVLADRVKESCSSPGTGTVTLLGAATGYQSFSAGIGANNTTYYVIADQSGANWEVGFGTVGSGGTTLARTTVLSSSNLGSLVNFSSGTQDVYCDYTAKTAVLSSNNPGTSGQVLTSNGTGVAPTWSSASSTATVSATAPSSPTNGQLWYDSTNGVMLVYYGSLWVEDYQSQYNSSPTLPDMNGGSASTTSWTYSLNCGAAQ